ncbi:hypothetical protein MRB53_036527 [Persea americana]|nr:hypothetical protein MRB53_036805 [Persea americana]KAJ8614661.1 hypothetical protein MRB53_036527 [Persea americana]
MLTLVTPEALSEYGKFWFDDQVLYPGYGETRDGVVGIPPSRRGVDQFGWLINSLLTPAKTVWWKTTVTRPEMGRFGVKLEGSGKVRVFAIANPLLQALVRPLHDWAMDVLRLLPTDGTFDQLRPLRRLRGKKDLYSFDLKAATDSFPVDVTGSMLIPFIGREAAQSWVHIIPHIGFVEHPIASTPALAHLGLVGGADSGYLLRHSASGISPLPILIWLAFPEYGGMDCYKLGMVRQFIIERVQPKDFNEDEIDSIRTFYCDDEDNMFERFLSSWVQMHIFTFFHGMLAFFSIIAFPSRNFYLRQ